MQYDLRELTAWVPNGSPFANLVSDLFGVDDLIKFQKDTTFLPKINIASISRSDSFERMETPVEKDLELVEFSSLHKVFMGDRNVVSKLDAVSQEMEDLKKSNATVYNYIGLLIREVKNIRNDSAFGNKRFFREILVATISALIVAAISQFALMDSYKKTYLVHTQSGDLNIRSSPIAEGRTNIITSLPYNHPVIVIGEQGNFFELDCSIFFPKISNQSCYAHKDYLVEYKKNSNYRINSRTMAGEAPATSIGNKGGDQPI